MTSIDIHDPKTADSALAELPPLPIGALVVGTYNLLCEAADLPQPHYLTISSTQRIDLQFPGKPSSQRAITRWALRFGGVLASEPCEGKRGPLTRCHLEFDYYGVAVKAYAYIPAATASNHVSYPHLPGRLHDCPACEAQCHCTPGDAECVYGGQHNGMAT
jgi:hypothetical protein